MIETEELAKAMPVALRGNITDELTDKLNLAIGDPEEARIIRDNMISYTGVLNEGKFRTDDYLSAVMYVSYKLMGHTNGDAYAKTFPDRYASLTARGATAKDISAYVSAYSKNKLVNLILEQTMIPTWVLNAEVYQEAINTQARLMTTAKSEMVRTQAANSILTHLKKPEKHEVELKVGVQETSGMKELQSMLTDLAEQQQKAIEAGMTTREVAHQSMKTVNEIEDAQIVEELPENDDEAEQ